MEKRERERERKEAFSIQRFANSSGSIYCMNYDVARLSVHDKSRFSPITCNRQCARTIRINFNALASSFSSARLYSAYIIYIYTLHEYRHGSGVLVFCSYIQFARLLARAELCKQRMGGGRWLRISEINIDTEP